MCESQNSMNQGLSEEMASNRGLNLQNLLPGTGEKKALAGFLSKDEDFASRCLADEQMLARFSLTYADLANELYAFTGRVKNGLYHAGDFKNRVFRSSGSQECPGEVCSEKTVCDYEVTQPKTGMKLTFSGLIPHLIDEHHFFEGRGTRYRVEPLDIIIMFEMYQDKNKAQEIVWQELQDHLGKSNGIPYNKAHNMLLFCAERPDFSQFIEKQLSQINPINKNSSTQILNLLSFLPYAGSEVKQKFTSMVSSIVAYYSKTEDILTIEKMLRFRRNVSTDRNYPIINHNYLPDIVMLKDSSVVSFCDQDLVQEGKDLAQVLVEGEKYWKVGNETDAERAYRNFDPDDLWALRNKFYTPKNRPSLHKILTDQTSKPPEYTPYSKIYRALQNADWPENPAQALAQYTPESFFIGIERNYPGLVARLAYYTRQWESRIDSSQSYCKKLNDTQLEERLHFYEWGATFGAATYDLHILLYSQFQQIITLKALNSHKGIDPLLQSFMDGIRILEDRLEGQDFFIQRIQKIIKSE